MINMKYPDFPVAFGVIRSVDSLAYDETLHKQIEEVQQKSKIKSMDDLLNSGSTWTVE